MAGCRMTRRLAILAAMSPTAAFSLNETLRAAGMRHNLFMGSQFKGATIDSDATYRTKHSREYSLSTVGNQCKWVATQPLQGKFTLKTCIQAYTYARSVDQKFRGHNLCWGNNNPAWLEYGEFSSAELAEILRHHIYSVMRGVKAAANGTSPLAWDVVNEAANNTAPFKPNTWYPALPNYVDIAFRAAREADPDTLLFYNDFSIAAAGTPKSDVVYQMVRSMRQRGIPIDGVGLQCHIKPWDDDNDDPEIESKFEPVPSFAAVSANIARLGALGLYVHITELDVSCPDPCTPAHLERQADVYELLLRACLAHPGVCTSFETWGFTDKYTWLTGSRCPTEACHPLPFDANYHPKPAAARMLARLQAEAPVLLPVGSRATARGDTSTTDSSITIDLMTEERLGNFEDDGWSGYACTFHEWTSCVNSSLVSCTDAASTCRRCKISCARAANAQMQFQFPAGGIFPVVEQFTIPPSTAIVGAANPNAPRDQSRQQTNISAQTWFIVPKLNALCGDDPMCRDTSAKGPTACTGDPATHRQGFLMSSDSSLMNINFQGADLGRAGSEGVLCGPGAIELPGCLSGVSCTGWGSGLTTGGGVVRNVLIQNVRLSDAVKRAEVAKMAGDCASGEALDADGKHVRAHQVSVWVAKLPSSERGHHENVLVDNLVSMNSRADGLNVHGAVRNFTLSHSHIQNSGDDCIGVWSAGIKSMTIRDTVAKDCAVTAGAQGNWGSCMGTYAFKSLAVDGLECFDPFVTTAGCNPRTHWTAMHINKAFANDCMPADATLSLTGVEYFASASPTSPLARPKCGSCKSCCGSCSEAGFDGLSVTVTDGSVPDGQCKRVSAGC